MTPPLLRVRGLRTQFHTDEGTVRAVDGVSFDVRRRETVAIVGESGAGKTVTGESVARIFRTPPGEIAEGEVEFDGVDLAALSEDELREYRGSRIAYVFQNPQGALNPVYSVGWQLREAVTLHRDVDGTEADEVAADLLERAGIPDPYETLETYPHELSGGQKQRVVIGMALAGEPDLLIADEPTTALDVTTQAAILELLEELQDELGMSILYVTHDLGVVAQIADRVVVMYGGKVMERAPTERLFASPKHPYTQGLISCLPEHGGGTTRLEGEPPDPFDPPSGCRFHPRCGHAVDDCRGGEQPPLHEVTGSSSTGKEEDEHVASCVYYGEGYDPSELSSEEGGSG